MAAEVRAGSLRAAARACRWVDDGAPGAVELLRELYTAGRSAWFVGVTGTPGAGKSTLTDALVSRCRAEGQRVAVVAVDPTSPFSGGAILGDRIRMQRHFGDADVFIRSVATRGALGGLSRTAADVANVLAAWGAEVVFLETVGVGQDELEVTFVADTTLVVSAPGLGDDVQALKAGILECADVFAVNKADRPGADAAVADLEAMLRLAPASTSWTPRILRTVATEGRGVAELHDALCEHRRIALRARREDHARSRRQLLVRLQAELADHLRGSLGEALDAAAARVATGASDPYSESEYLWSVLESYPQRRS